jgi:hypothetical protein
MARDAVRKPARTSEASAGAACARENSRELRTARAGQPAQGRERAQHGDVGAGRERPAPRTNRPLEQLGTRCVDPERSGRARSRVHRFSSLAGGVEARLSAAQTQATYRRGRRRPAARLHPSRSRLVEFPTRPARMCKPARRACRNSTSPCGVRVRERAAAERASATAARAGARRRTPGRASPPR